MKPDANHRSLVAAAVAAILLLLASGAGYRLLAQYLNRPSDSVPLPRGTLAKAMPMSIGVWQGQDVPVEEAVVKVAACDDFVSRRYTKRNEAVSLWIAYGIRARDLVPHRPEICYPGAGWTLESARPTDIPFGADQPLECKVYQFMRGGFGTEAMVVLNYYIVDGQYSPDVSLLRSKALRGASGVRYVAQIQVTSSIRGHLTPDAAAESVKAFAADSAKAIRAMMPDASDGQSPRTAGLAPASQAVLGRKAK